MVNFINILISRKSLLYGFADNLLGHLHLSKACLFSYHYNEFLYVSLYQWKIVLTFFINDVKLQLNNEFYAIILLHKVVENSKLVILLMDIFQTLLHSFKDLIKHLVLIYLKFVFFLNIDS